MAETDRPVEAGPALTTEIHEVQALFPSDAALQDAIARLSLLGIDRADVSLPQVTVLPGQTGAPEADTGNPDTDVDNRQMRTMHASMAGSVGALAAAGAIIGTGGAAAVGVATAAAIGAAVGAGAVTEAGSHLLDARQHEVREQAAREGRLVLAVNLRDLAKEERVREALREAGASRVESVHQMAQGISAASWTGE